MRIHELIWPEDRIDHVARHHITPEEVEEVCFSKPLILREKSERENPVYYTLGETAADRHLFCAVIQFPDGRGYPVTARSMKPTERQRFMQWKRR